MTQLDPSPGIYAEQGGRSYASCGLILVALIAQIGFLGFSMPLNELASGGWFFNIDNPYHIYQLELGRALQAQGRWMGYDPFFGAGDLAGLNSNVSARFALVIAAFMPASLPITSVYAVYVLICSLVAPISIWGLGQVLRWSLWHKIFALVIGFLLWWVGVFHWYHTAGMVSFVCACYVAPLYAAWTYSLCDPATPARPAKMLWAGLAGGAGMWLHPLFCIPVVLLFLCFVLLGSGRNRFWLLLGRACVIAIVTALLSLPWVLGLARIGAHISGEQPYQKAVGLQILIDSLGFGTGGATGALINSLLVAICLIGVSVGRGGKQWTVRPFLMVGLGLLLFAAFAASSPILAKVQPNRFVGPAYLLIGMAAAYYLAALVGWAKVQGHSASKVGVLSVGVLVALFLGRELQREISPGSHGHHGKAPPEISSTPQVVAQLENWIKTNTSENGRILFQTSLGRVHGGGHVAGYLAATTRREFMGAAYPHFMPQLSCWDTSCFGRAISTMPHDFFWRAIENFNVSWVIAHSSEFKSFLQSIPEIKMVAAFDGISIYQVDGMRTFVQAGSGQVLGRDFNRIEVGDVSGPALTLRYHWVPGLETVPSSRIESYAWSADFPPLIRIINPPAKFILRLAD